MSDLSSELNRFVTLHALRSAHPDVLREALRPAPDETKLISALRAHNDEQHSQLKELVNLLPAEDGPKSDLPGNSRKKSVFEGTTSRVKTLWDGGK
jgi:hypothetical protein